MTTQSAPRAGRPLRALLLVVGLAAALAVGCGGPSGSSASGQAASATLADTLDKLRLIGRDECATHPSATIYPRCTRFLRELENALNSVKNEAKELPQAGSINGAVQPIESAMDDFTQRGCAPPPGQPPSGTGGPVDAPCVADLTEVQSGLRQLVAVLSPVVSEGATPR
ncbi:hypothetical protein ACVGVM_07530 [Pseudonocardia bannensis]|uniref:Uncharacterized protein n=1 Tax=Pseudonocardia bannensis TaxID=630973 RepID=A0A848DIK3_9PSEU|nr:hypothetical protein [Pseudonocardia bannensis]NMH92520.1 hypothetical protein [Pseudonocardia bannensis]